MTPGAITAALATIAEGRVGDFTPFELAFITDVLRERAVGAVADWRHEIFGHIAAARAEITAVRKATGATVWSSARGTGDLAVHRDLASVFDMAIGDLEPGDVSGCGSALQQWAGDRILGDAVRGIIGRVAQDRPRLEAERRASGRWKWGIDERRMPGR